MSCRLATRQGLHGSGFWVSGSRVQELLLFCIMPFGTFALHMDSVVDCAQAHCVKRIIRELLAHGLTDNCHYQSCERFW